MQATLIILETYGIEYFKIVFLNNYNCVYKTPFRKSSHILSMYLNNVASYSMCVFTCILFAFVICALNKDPR